MAVLEEAGKVRLRYIIPELKWFRRSQIIYTKNWMHHANNYFTNLYAKILLFKRGADLVLYQGLKYDFFFGRGGGLIMISVAYYIDVQLGSQFL